MAQLGKAGIELPGWLIYIVLGLIVLALLLYIGGTQIGKRVGAFVDLSSLFASQKASEVVEINFEKLLDDNLNKSEAGKLEEENRQRITLFESQNTISKEEAVMLRSVLSGYVKFASANILFNEIRAGKIKLDDASLRKLKLEFGELARWDPKLAMTSKALERLDTVSCRPEKFKDSNSCNSAQNKNFCWWDTHWIDECLSCLLINDCANYSNKASCIANPCAGKLTNVKGCNWIDRKCIAVRA